MKSGAKKKKINMQNGNTRAGVAESPDLDGRGQGCVGWRQLGIVRVALSKERNRIQISVGKLPEETNTLGVVQLLMLHQRLNARRRLRTLSSSRLRE